LFLHLETPAPLAKLNPNNFLPEKSFLEVLRDLPRESDSCIQDKGHLLHRSNLLPACYCMLLRMIVIRPDEISEDFKSCFEAFGGRK
jgi:hypothetical protein